MTATSTPEPVAELVAPEGILREWFGGDRYARDYEYLDANYGKQAQQVADWLNRTITAERDRLRKTLEAVRFNLTYKGAYDENSIMIEGIDAALAAASPVPPSNEIAELKEKIAALEKLRPVWAQGHTSDSVAAQVSSGALASIWSVLGVSNQTDCMAALKRLIGPAPAPEKEARHPIDDGPVWVWDDLSYKNGRSLPPVLDKEAAEDERDRLYEIAHGEAEVLHYFASKETRRFLSQHGAMLPADRARLRALAASGEADER
jgi:hypothetical protein